MSRFSLFASLVSLVGFVVVVSAHPDKSADEPTLERRFAGDVLPFVKSHCLTCHGTDKQEGKLDLSGDSSIAAVVKNHRVWDLVLERLEAGEMPPKKALRQPTPHERKLVSEWINELRDHEARRHAGDPGPVLARRLSNAEFDNTIRDLTGIDIRPTREFPVDPANEAGFDNSGESLTMSPALVKKYLTAARLVADHLVLKPEGFVFAPHPAVTETDRDKFCVQRIVDFYQRHNVDLADYFFAAWQIQHRQALGKWDTSLNDFADEGRLSAKYLETIFSVMTTGTAVGPLGEIQTEWRKLKKPGDVEDVRPHSNPRTENVGGAKPAGSLFVSPERAEVRRECERLRDVVIKLRKELDKPVEKLHVKGQSDGSQPLVLWWNRKLAAQRQHYSSDGKDPALDLARHHFCSVFPNAFAITSRGHYADAKLGADVRLLTAGFHLIPHFPDDFPRLGMRFAPHT